LNEPFRYFAKQPSGGAMVTVWNRLLVVYDAEGADQGVVNLPATARSVSVSPDGTLAIVGHADSVSFIDLDTRQILATYPVDADVGDVLVSDEGYGYIFPASDQWVSILSVDSRTGSVSTMTGGSHRAGTQVKMHPNGRKGYGADNGLSPSDVERYNFGTDGSVAVAYDSPYHGDFSFCGDIWISEDGERALTPCGVMVRTTEDQSTDLTYDMQLTGVNGRIRDASYGAFSGNWFLIESPSNPGETMVRAIDAQSGEEVYRLELPLSKATSGSQLYARYVSASQDEDSVLILAQDHQTNPQNYYIVKYKAPDTSTLDLPPELKVPKYSAGQTNEEVILNASESFDPEGMGLTFDWVVVSQPDLSDIIPVGIDAARLRFTPEVGGLYEFEVTASDGLKTSETQRVTVYVSDQTGLDLYRFEGEVVDAEYSKSLNILAYITEDAAVLHLLHLDDYSETEIVLPRIGYSVGISPDGLYAAVSHAALGSLIDLTEEEVTDTQQYNEDWGDIVLDKNLRAHLVPRRDQWTRFVTLDFGASSFDSSYGARAGTRLRMHPNGVWVYGANVGVSPSDIEKWDVSAATAVPKGDSPYHGDYYMSGNIWISEDGDDLLVAGGNLFNSSDDPAVDMTYLDVLPGTSFVNWADHSAETNKWVAAIRGAGSEEEVAVFADTDFQRLGTVDLEDLPTSSGAYPVSPTRVFLTDNGLQVLLLSSRDAGEDRFVLQVSAMN